MEILITLALVMLVLMAGTSVEAGLPTEPIYTYDARPLKELAGGDMKAANEVWDNLHLLAALQGLANRRTPRLYVYYCEGFGLDTDEFWMDWYREENGWLKGLEIKPLESIEEAIQTFHPFIKGVVVWDPKVPATSNLASTAAGSEGLLPVRYDLSPDSLYTKLTQQLGLLPKLWLLNPDGSSLFTGEGEIPGLGIPSTGSPKCDAYKWALERWVKSGKGAPGIAAYYIDYFWALYTKNDRGEMHTLTNQDYFIANKAFFFDLSPWGDEVATDEPASPVGLDKQVFFEVMHALYEQAEGGILQVGGFPAWPYKYTSSGQVGGKHEPVPTEWEFGKLISQFNGYMEADAAGLGGIANASFHQHYPLKVQYDQPNPKPTFEDWKAAGYITPEGKVANLCFVGHYVGDYDSPSWFYKAMPVFFNDPRRGETPLPWAPVPILSDRVPQAMAYVYENASPNDYFIAGDSGAGYLNPRALTVRPETGLPSGLAAWTEHCVRYYSRWGMTISGFVLDGSGGASTEEEWAAYKQFSPDGLGTHFDPGIAVHQGIGACREIDLDGTPEQAAADIARRARGVNEGPVFQWRRSILKSPTWYAEVADALATSQPEARAVVVDPYTFFGLIKYHLEHKEN